MARTPGALNKRTRAALHAAQTGVLGGGGESPVDFLLGVMRNGKKPDALRVEAAKAVAPYLAPKLSAIELTERNDDETLTEAEILAQLKSLLEIHPELIYQVRTIENAATPEIESNFYNPCC